MHILKKHKAQQLINSICINILPMRCKHRQRELVQDSIVRDYELVDIERGGRIIVNSLCILCLCLFFSPSLLFEEACWREGTSLSN